MSKKPIRVDANTFQVQLDTLASTMIERIKDEWPSVLGDPGFAQGFFLMNMRYARDIFRAVRSICSDERQEDHRWRWNEILFLPPTNRTLLDVLFNQIFLSEDILKQSNWYHQSGWREQKLELDRLKREYGALPEWKQNLADYQALVDRGVDLFGISAEQIANPKLIQSWPTPGQMPDYGINPLNRNDDRQFLHYLTDWFYREHSAQSHMSFLGQMKLSPLLFREEVGKERRDEIEQQRLPLILGQLVSRTAFLLLSIISETQNKFRFTGEIELRILEIWHALMPAFPEAKEIFDRRYSTFFPAKLIGPASFT